jgi:hypothetical protein
MAIRGHVTDGAIAATIRRGAICRLRRHRLSRQLHTRDTEAGLVPGL